MEKEKERDQKKGYSREFPGDLSAGLCFHCLTRSDPQSGPKIPQTAWYSPKFKQKEELLEKVTLILDLNDE